MITLTAALANRSAMTWNAPLFQTGKGTWKTEREHETTKKWKDSFFSCQKETYSHVYIYIVYIHIYIYRFHDEICADALGCVVGFNGSGAHRHRGFLCSWRRRLCTLCTIVCCCREWQCSHDKCSPQHLRHFRLGVPVSETCPEQERTALGRLSIMLFRGVCLNFMSSSVNLTADSWCPPAPFFPCLCIDLLGPSRQTKGCPALRRAPNPRNLLFTSQGSPLSQPGGKIIPCQVSGKNG